ncbi:hypothetical protein QOZ80_7AG0570350 [Eleusine coracana subsp. coracana]|nr:hypothetical protein QOZ80_7AG0570350 [Eleusine coracana subsp. coracana]
MPHARELLVPALALLLTLATADDNRGSLASSHRVCGSQGKYASGSAYEANLKRLAATVTADVTASSCNCSSRRIDSDLPDQQVSVSAVCPSYLGAKMPADCGACVALGFREAKRLCPYKKAAIIEVGNGACTVMFSEVRGSGVDFEDDVDFTGILEEIEMEPPWFLDRDLLFMLLFQATGILFVMLMLLLVWRRDVIS